MSFVRAVSVESRTMHVRDEDVFIAPPLEKRRLQCYLALIVADIASLLAGSWVAGYFYLGSQGSLVAIAQGQLLLPLFLTVALYNGAFSMTALERPWIGIVRAEVALIAASAMLIFIAFYTKSSTDFSRVSVTLGMLASGAFVAWLRLQMRSFVSWRCGERVFNELIIDDDGPKVHLPGAFRVSARALGLKPALDDPHALDRIGMVLRNIDRVAISCPPKRRAAWAMMLKGANVSGEVLDDTVLELGAQGARVIGDHGWLMVSAGPLGMRARATKRLLDLALSIGALALLLPVLLAVALAIKLEDGGPVFFLQRRLGRGNRFFDVVKFRSMTFAHGGDRDGTISATREDARVTWVGGLIRRTSIDELPQLVNVIRGDMSLVGPRPHAIGSQAGDKLFWEVDLRYWQRHSLKPGMSGLAQIRGFRGATDHERDLVNRLQSDLEYLEGWTIWRDITIIAMTLRVLVHDRAY